MSRPGYVYCLCFVRTIGGDGPRSRAGHYIGWARDVERRLAQHAAGRGSAITRYLHEQGIGFFVSAVIPGGRDLERAIKARKKLGGGICGACVPASWEAGR
jgi:hypothetical protein